MAKKAEQGVAEVTAENVDDLTDEQIAAMMAEGGDQEVTEQEGAAQEAEKAPEGGDDAKGDEKAAGDDDSAGNGDDTGDDDAQKAESVPFKRYDYERNRRKQIEQEAKEEKERWQKRFDELLKVQGKPEEKAKPVDEIPDPDTDPVGAVRWAREQIIQQQQERTQQTEAQRQEQEQREASMRLLQEANEEFAAAESGDPSVRQAYEALVKSFAAEAKAYRMTPQQTQQYLQQTEFQHIAYAKQAGIPIADYITGLASARGWAPQAEPAQQQDNARQAEANRDEARRRSTTLSNGGGAPGVSDTLTAEDILSMSDKEFDALIAKHGSVADALAAQ